MSWGLRPPKRKQHKNNRHDMLYDLSREIDRQRFQLRVEKLLDRRVAVELTEKTRRTNSQNAYIHLLIGLVAMETGNSIAYSKEVYFKRLANAPLFVVTATDQLAGKVEYIRSSADLSKEEMTIAIERFKRWGAENGIYMPEPGDETLLREIEIEMARQAKYL